MRLYSAHLHAPDSPRAGRTPVLVKEGFCWPCLFLGWIVLLLYRSWIAALLLGALSIVLALGLRGLPGAWAALLGWQLLIACFAHDLRRWELGLHGLQAGPLVAGPDRDAALLRLLDRRPETARSRP